MNWYSKSQFSRIAKRGKDIIVDFDKTICQDATYPKMGKPIDGAKEALQELLDEGYRVRVYTCRLNGKKMKEVGKKAYYRLKSKIEQHLNDHEIPFTDLVLWSEGKPFGECYVDDRNVAFDGDWKKTVRKILAGSSGFQVRKTFAKQCTSGKCNR